MQENEGTTTDVAEEHDAAAEPETKAPAPKHRATYAKDKRKGGYIIRVQGPYPDKFSNRTVPVELRSGAKQQEKLTDLIWTGIDEATGDKVSLYKFEQKPRTQEDLPF